MPTVTVVDWMKGLDKSTVIHQMSIPGTHESCALYGGGPTQCQWHSITELLNRGVRFLDIRCVHAVGSLGSAEFPIYHNTIYQETNFQAVQSACADFLNSYPSECILMNVQHEMNDALTNRSEDSFLEMFVTLYDPALFIFPGTTLDLGSCRGKIVLVRAFDGLTSKGWPDLIPGTNTSLPADGGLQWNGFDNDGLSENSIFKTQNGWSAYNSGSWDEQNAAKASAVKDYLRLAADALSRTGVIAQFYLNFLSRAAGGYVGDAAQATNNTILDFLKNEMSDTTKLLGVLPIDFVGNTGDGADCLESTIIRHNPFMAGYSFV